MKAAQDQPLNAPLGGPTGRRRSTVRGRFPVEDTGGGRTGGSAMRDFDNAYTVDAFTGFPVHRVDSGNWRRGQLVRRFSPAFLMPPGNPQYDPTSPSHWIVSGGT